MAPTSEDVYKVLQSIDARLATLTQHFGIGARPASSQSAATGTIAPDHVLDGQYGDPIVKKKDPKDWTGSSMKGKKFSECPPEYLEMVADREDYFLETNQASLQDAQEKDDQDALKKNIKYNQLDASRARGWAQRKRNGWQPPAPEPDAFGTTGDAPLTADEIPFLWLLPALVVLHTVAALC
jgi:hypothetical protein